MNDYLKEATDLLRLALIENCLTRELQDKIFDLFNKIAIDCPIKKEYGEDFCERCPKC